jgi:histidine triad (HIT) family protein
MAKNRKYSLHAGKFIPGTGQSLKCERPSRGRHEARLFAANKVKGSPRQPASRGGAVLSLFGDYDPDNIFAKIIRGEVPCYKVYEDKDVLAFLDLFPQARGHTLVIPKHGTARNILEVDPDTLCILYRTAQKLAKGLVEELKPDGIQVLQMNGGPGGQSVYHIHVHLIPRWPGQPLGIHAQVKGNSEELEALAQQLAKRFQSLAD